MIDKLSVQVLNARIGEEAKSLKNLTEPSKPFEITTYGLLIALYYQKRSEVPGKPA